MNKPTLHREVPMESRVLIPSTYRNDGKSRLGTVVGISSMHVIFTYIVLLDEPIKDFRAVVVNGPELEAEDGSNWRLINQSDIDEITEYVASIEKMIP